MCRHPFRSERMRFFERNPVRTDSISLVLLLLLIAGAVRTEGTAQPIGLRTDENDLSMQREGNPPMVVLTRTPPEPEVHPDDFEVREGFKLIDSLDEFRTAIEQDHQKIRLKPGVYRVDTVDPTENGYVQLFAVTGSGNHFDLRGVVIETPSSTQDRLPMKSHFTHTWTIFGEDNTFEGGYFRNVVDGGYREYVTTNNEFFVKGDNTTFRNCTFVIRGSFPYGYSDFYGKGGASWVVHPNNKHSFMNVQDVNGFELIDSELYQQSFGHGVHFHETKSGRIVDCSLYGTVRPTNDIIEPGKAIPKGLNSFTETNVYSPPGRYESVGPARKNDYRIMVRKTRPIPPNEMIPLTEDGVRSYNNVRDILVKDTYIERFRSNVTLTGPGDYIIDSVTSREAGNIGFEVASRRGDVIVRNTRGDLAFDPLVDLTTRAGVTSNSFFELTVLSARDPEAEKTFTSKELEAPKCVGSIQGEQTTFLFRDGTERELPDRFNYIQLENRGLIDSVLINLTSAEVRLNEKATGSLILSGGPVTGRNGENTVKHLSFPEQFESVINEPGDD